ncbi:MAG: AbrB family transcriptional regulator [Roseiarcus sp.]
MHGRSQAVRLLKAFRFSDAEAPVSKSEPAALDIAAWRARLAAFRDSPLPEASDDPPLAPDEMILFE